NELLQIVDRDVFELGVDLDLAEFVLVTLFDGEGDVETTAIGRELGHRGDHTEVGVTLAEVVASQLLAVEGQTIGIVVVVRLKEIPPDRFAGRDLVAQRAVGERLVADEDDSVDARGRAFVDLEDEVDAILRELHGLRLDLRGEAAGATIDLDDALNVGLHLGAR